MDGKKPISDPIKVLLVSPYPIQNPKPHALLAQQLGIELVVAYCSEPEGGGGLEFINQQQFDINVWEGYKYIKVKNRAWKRDLSSFFGLINPGLFSLVYKNDCVVVYGHAYLSLWIAIFSAKLFRKKLILTTDATHAEAPGGGNWKITAKRYVFPFLYNILSHKVFVPSTASRLFLESVGVKKERIVITPYTVDHDFIRSIKENTNRVEFRNGLGIQPNVPVAVFCAKFIPRKRPQDAIKAFAEANVPNSVLIMIGDGPLKPELTKLVMELGIDRQVIFTGLVNYSQLPAYYACSDVLLFTSETEQFGLPVNEAMVCGIPVIVSDEIGSRLDLVIEGQTGYSYPCGNIPKLAQVIAEMLTDLTKTSEMGRNALEIMNTWSPEVNASRKSEAIKSLFSLS